MKVEKFTYSAGCGIATGKQWARVETVRPDGQPLFLSVGRAMDRRHLFHFHSEVGDMPHGPDGTYQANSDDLDKAVEVALAHCLKAEPLTRADLTESA